MTLRLINVSKNYPVRGGERTILSNISMTVQPHQKLGILGVNGAGKSTLIRLMSGAERPTSGRIERAMRVSWPLAFSGGFQGNQTGLDCLRFICRIYGVPFSEIPSKVDYVQAFSELGVYFKEPIETYSSGMLARLSFAISMAIEFDCFLIDEVTAVGDDRFHEKCHEELFVKRKDRAIIIVSHNMHYVRQFCEHVAVLSDGRLYSFDDFDEAYRFYQSIRVEISRYDVAAAYRFLLGREPDTDERVIEFHLGHSSWRTLRRGFIATEEFKRRLSALQLNEAEDSYLNQSPLSKQDVVLGYRLVLGQTLDANKMDEVLCTHQNIASLSRSLLLSNDFLKQYSYLAALG